MGIVGWFKQKFNIGGVKLSIVEVAPITTEEGWIRGKIAISTKEPAYGKLTYKLMCETTTGKGAEKKTSTSTLSQTSILIGFALEENQSTTEDFTFDYSLKNWFEQKGGVLGAAAKAFSLVKSAVQEKGIDDYYVEVTAQIPGVWANPSARRPITVAVAR